MFTLDVNNMPSYKGYLLLLILQSLLFSTSTLETWSYDLHMPGVRTKKANEYVTYQFSLPLMDRTVYILEYIPQPNYSTTHHMIIYGCADASMNPNGLSLDYSNCAQLLYAWAHGATKLTLPSGVGVPVGPSTNIRGFLLELHYLPVVTYPDYAGVRLIVTETPQPRIAGVFLMALDSGVIRPHSSSEVLDISCKLPEEVSFTLIAMRVHAHSLSKKVVAYRVATDKSEQQLLGRGDPRWPQRFYALKDLQVESNSIDLHGGDILLGRCFYDSTNKTTVTRIGSTHVDEMCNVYMLYHTSPSKMPLIDVDFCMQNKSPKLTSNVMEQESHDDKRPVPTPNHPTSVIMGYFNGRPHPTFSLPTKLHIRGLAVGQLSAAASIQSGNRHDLLILHRGPNHWTIKSFNSDHSYLGHPKQTVIDPLVLMDPSTQNLKQKFGSGHFLIPHGLFVSHKVNKPDAIFVTDVALHQVFKFDWGLWDKPALVLGTRLHPGNSIAQFCQPADVTVSSTGELFVADGYCNNRIVKFSPNGTYITHWSTIISPSRPINFSSTRSRKPTDLDQPQAIVHSITIIPSHSGSLEQVCAANRELGELVCFTLSGQLIARYSGNSLPPGLYAVKYSEKYGLLFGLNVAFNEFNDAAATTGIMINPIRPRSLNEYDSTVDQTSAVVGYFASPNLQVSHDLALSPDGTTLYVVETNRIGIHRFTINSQKLSVDQPNNIVQVLHQVLLTTHMDKLSGLQWAGFSMLFLILLFLITIVFIRVCWCGRKHSNIDVTRHNPRSSRWVRRPGNAKRVGFRLLNQDDELSDDFNDGDEEGEGDQEDIILERSFHRDPLALRVDAENRPLKAKRNLQPFPTGNGSTFKQSSLKVENQSTKESVA